ncbi:lipase family protein [Micrococcus sp. FDAARGOS_333]|uniref:lipase family protein n=1 Tax=Micrococcus sp. FDAARGOS_333 TaxID=1930558 RepID=UPI000B4E5EAF|nr:lipase family protein [Micrococcus sp. FDAARGOS_333]PNL17177.1 lipase [Micrococcus sp. FDAARGOS_333]
MTTSRPSRLTTLAAAVSLGLGATFAGAAPAAAQQGMGPEQEAAVQELSTAPTTAERAQWDAARTALAQAADEDFYAAPDSIPGTPGALIRQEPMDFYLDPVKLIRIPATATRIMYSSVSATGEPIAVTGTVLEPEKQWTGSGERPVIAYAVGTQGVGDQCAPSKTLSTGEQYEGVGISTLLNKGYTVVVTDYEGLGTEGLHTYMVRQSQAHTVLDSVRAAAGLEGSGVTATSPVAIAGYSQGGGAAAAAAELAGEYAPELDVKAAYAGAPPADLTQVADAIDGGGSAAFLLFAMAGHFEAYGVDPSLYLNALGMQTLEEASTACTSDGSAFADLDSSTITSSGQSFPELVRSDRLLAGILADQRLGHQGRHPEMPVMIAHSLTDDVIPYRTGRELGHRWCAEGAQVRFDPVFTPTHVGGYVAALPRATGFLDAALNDRRTADSCGWF